MLMVEGILLDALIELESIVEGLSVARGTDILRQAIDCEADGIELLLRIEGLSLAIEAPIHTAILWVDEMVDEVLLCPCGHLEILGVAEDAVGRGERP